MNLSAAMRILERRHNAVFSIHILHPVFLESEALHLTPDQYLHHGEFCRHTKMHGQLTVCTRNKDRSLEIARKGRFFSGLCPFGIWDSACPVLHGGELFAVIYAGSGRPAGKRIDWDGPQPPEITPGKAAGLRRASLFLKELILLEIELRESTVGTGGKQRPPDHYIRNVQFLIDCRFSEPLSLEDAAETLRITPNHLGELIRRETGKNFRTLLLERRIEEAKIYLKLHRNLSVSQIAALCGFHDSNYFSTCFRRITRTAPREYRRQETTGKESAFTDGISSAAAH